MVNRGRQDGSGKGVGISNGLRRNANTGPCLNVGSGGFGNGAGKGNGKNRWK